MNRTTSIQNFGGNVAFRPQAYYRPTTEQEVLSILDQHRGRRIRVIGRLHSWSEAPRGDDVVLDLQELNQVRCEQRADGVWATIQAGCQIKQAVRELQRQASSTLPSLGLITEQSIAGAVSTGTHGSGKHSLSHYVGQVRIAVYDPQTGRATIRTVDDGPELRAARCSLGCLGVILSVGLFCRPSYRVQEHFRFQPTLDHVLAAEEEYPLQQFYLVPWKWRYLAQHRRETTSRRSLLAGLYRVYWFLVVDVSLHLVLLVLARWLGSRKLIHGFYRFVLSWTLVRRWKVVDRSPAMLTMEHELFRHIEIEIFVTRSQLADTLSFVQQLLKYCDGDDRAIDRAIWDRLSQHSTGDVESVRGLLGTYTHHYPICVRKVLADDTLISMATSDSEPYYAISLISYVRPRDRAGFLSFANALAAVAARLFQARPHWGKVCPLDRRTLAALYAHLGEFQRICDAFDPQRAFRNRWLDEVIFHGEPSLPA